MDTNNEIQVNSQHYKFETYMDQRRWASVWYQIREITRLNPRKVLEIGTGTGLLKACLTALRVSITTLDVDPELEPDILASAVDIPVEDQSYDLCCAFQVLEHFEFATSVSVFSEMVRVSSRFVLISLPDSSRRWPYSLYFPKFGIKNFTIKVPQWPKIHQFDGQHYWEIGKQHYSETEVIDSLTKLHDLKLLKRFTVPQNPYHRFFIFEKI